MTVIFVFGSFSEKSTVEELQASEVEWFFLFINGYHGNQETNNKNMAAVNPVLLGISNNSFSYFCLVFQRWNVESHKKSALHLLQMSLLLNCKRYRKLPKYKKDPILVHLFFITKFSRSKSFQGHLKVISAFLIYSKPFVIERWIQILY